MAGNLQPERLGAAPSPAEGAPVVGPDGIVESGNARTLAIRRAYAQGGAQAQAYRNYLQSQGYDTSDMKMPVLIRRRVTDMTPADRMRFVQEANSSPALAMSATERARVDASRLPDRALDLYRGGDVASAENGDFVRAYVNAVPTRGEEGVYATPDGRLSVEGAQRIRNALTYKAYGDSNLVGSLAETGDENIKAFGNALADGAPSFARLHSEIARGSVDPRMDISKDLLDAADIVRKARDGHVPVSDIVAQSDALPVTEEILRAAYGEDLRGRMSRARFAEVLKSYAGAAEGQSTEARLFGENASPLELVSNARAKYGQSQSSAELPGIAAAARAGSGNAGQETPGYGLGAARAASSGQVPNAGGTGRTAAQSDSVLPQARLSPNFDTEAIARLRAARQATLDRKQTFDTGAVGSVLRAGPAGTPYRVLDSQVAAKFFNAGKTSAEDVAAYIKAVGDRPDAMVALQDYAASTLRGFAEKNGVLDPAKVDTWLSKHADALKPFPELAAKFRDAAAAQDAVTEAMGARKAAFDGYQNGAARFFLGRDPIKGIGQALASPNPAAEVRNIVSAVARDPEALAGMRRAFVDYMRQRVLSTAEAGDTGISLIKSDAAQKFIRANAGPIKELFGQRGLDNMEAVAADPQRANRSIAGTKLPGGSNTPQDLAAKVRTEAAESVLSKIIHHGSLGVGMAGGAAGGWVGAAVGWLGTTAVNAFRSVGMRKLDDLVGEAMLNPDLARTLLQRATPQATPQIARTLGAQLQALTTTSSVRAAGADNQAQSGAPAPILPRAAYQMAPIDRRTVTARILGGQVVPERSSGNAARQRIASALLGYGP